MNPTWKNTLNITFQKTWFEIAESLQTVTARGQFYHAIFRYAFRGESPRFSGMLKTYFDMIKPLLDNKLNQRKRDARRKRGSGTCHTENHMENHAVEHMENNMENSVPPATPARDINDARAPARVSINNTPEEREKNKQKEKETTTFSALLPPHLQTPSFLAKWEEWERFRRLKRKPISRMAAVRQIKMLSALDPVAAAETIDRSIQNDYQGLFPVTARAPQSNNHPQQTQRKDYTGV